MMTICAAITAAWGTVPMVYLDEFLEEMPARCKAVVNAMACITRYEIVGLVLIERFLGILSSMRKALIHSVVYLHSVTRLKLTVR